MNLYDIFYKTVDGDSIYILSNIMNNDTSDNNIIFNRYQDVSLCDNNNKYYFFNDYNFDNFLFRNFVIKNNLKHRNLFYSFIIHDNKIKIMKFGIRIKEKIENELYENKDIIVDFKKYFYYPKKLNLRLEFIQQFPSYDKSYFDKNVSQQPEILNDNEYFLKKLKDVRLEFEKFIINNSLKNNLDIVKKINLDNNGFWSNPIIKSYLRTSKLKEIFNYE